MIGKIIFRRIRGKLIPIRMNKKSSDFISKKEAHDSFKAKGLRDMIQNDLPNSGSLIHKKANVSFQLSFVESGKIKNGNVKKALDEAMKFVRKNRKKLEE